MEASKARELSNRALENDTPPRRWMEAIYNQITIAATQGKRSITHPFQGLRMTYPDPQQTKLIWRQLAADGYEVVHHKNPDPGDPRSSDYTEIKW